MAIKKEPFVTYTLEEERKWKPKQNTVSFEYSVFGSPKQKIGDFVQSKLSGWSA